MQIVLIGAGNLGFHLGRKLQEVGENILQVFSRDETKARHLADQIHASPITALKEINPTADLYLLAVHDKAIPEIFEQLDTAGLPQKFIAHTSGATPLHPVMPDSSLSHLYRHGVFYPLQTFSLARQPDFSQIPICVDAGNAADLLILESLALKISSNVFHLDDEQRAVTHLAAVFVNNFPNHLFALGKEIMAAKNLPFSILLPLIRETVAKLETGAPEAMQTGPAIRGDEATIRRHLQLLEEEPEIQEVYKKLTASIQARGKQASDG